jgi:hypothetical protein
MWDGMQYLVGCSWVEMCDVGWDATRLHSIHIYTRVFIK